LNELIGAKLFAFFSSFVMGFRSNTGLLAQAIN